LQLDLGVDQQQHLAQPLGDGVGFEHRLLVLEPEVQVVGDVIGELPGILDVQHELGDLGLDVAAARFDQVGEALLEFAEAGLDDHGVALRNLDGGYGRFDQSGVVEVLFDPHPGEGAYQHLDAAVRVLLHPHDVAGGADPEQIVGVGLLDLAVTLTDDDDGAVTIERGVDGPDRDGPAGIDRHDHRGKQHRAAHRADRHRCFEGGVGRLCHVAHLSLVGGSVAARLMKT
jgi:hypothetical protein